MHMIGHNDKTVDIMPLFFQVIEPVVNNIIAVYFINQRQPLVAGEGDEKHAAAVWYGSLYRHTLKIIQKMGL